MKELIDSKVLNRLLRKDEKILIAVSTGIDSMSLLDFLYKKGYDLVVAHVNHKRRAESDNEYIFLKGYCEKLNIPFNGYEINEDIDSNFQMEARIIRYNFFREVAKKYNSKTIVTAHQNDDLVETILFRLIRGTSLKGYSGIKELSYIDDFKIVRPLLYTKRSEIEEYQKENNIPFFLDSSNEENHYTRNKIRHLVVPSLKEINRDYYSAISNFSSDMIDVYEHIRKESDEFINSKATIKKDSISYSFNDFNILDRAIKKEVLIESINIISSNTVEVPHERIETILSLENESEYKEIEIKNGYCLYLEYQVITIKKKREIPKINIELNSLGEFYLDDKHKVLISHKIHELPKKNSYMLCYNMEDEIFPVTVRYVNEGDKIKVKGITKKVYDLLKEYKVPKSERERQLVFLNKNGIFFVPNIIRKETDESLENKIYITVYEVD